MPDCDNYGATSLPKTRPQETASIRQTQFQCWSLYEEHGEVVLGFLDLQWPTTSWSIFPLEYNAVTFYSKNSSCPLSSVRYCRRVLRHSPRMPVLLPLQRTQQKLVHNIPQKNESPHTSFTRSIGIDPTLPWSEFQRCRRIARCGFFFQTQIILAFHLVLWLFITDLLAQTKAN